MTLTDPEWRIKSRPCPFFQHGRCLFADSCNFLHTVSVRPSSGVTMIDTPTKQEESVPRQYPSPPIVMVESPRSTLSSRSPRLSGLLHALKDVIGEELEDISSDASEEAGLEPGITYVPEETNTVVPKQGFTAISSDEETSPTEAVLGAYTEIAVDDEHPVAPSSPQEYYTVDDDVENLPDCSDDEHTIRIPVHSPRHYATQPVPDKGSTTRPHSHLRSGSTQRSQPLTHRPLHLQLEPVAFTDIHLADMDCETIIDSGYAESWQPPSPLAISPPRTPVRNSTLDLLSSPFGSPPTVRILSQANLLRKLGFTASVDTDRDAVSDISLDCPADCDSPRHDLGKHPTRRSDRQACNSGNAAPETPSDGTKLANPNIGSGEHPNSTSSPREADSHVLQSTAGALPLGDPQDSISSKSDTGKSFPSHLGELASSNHTAHFNNDASDSAVPVARLAYLGNRTLSGSGNNEPEVPLNKEHSNNNSPPRKSRHEYAQISSPELSLLDKSPSRERNLPPPVDPMDRKTRASAVKPLAIASFLPSPSSPQQLHHSVCSSVSSVQSTVTDASRRASLGWKKSTASRNRSKETPMSSRLQRASRRPSDSVIDSSTSNRGHPEQVSPTYCPSCGCAPLKLPPVASPDYESSAFPGHTTGGSSIASHYRSPVSSSSSSLSLPSFVSSAKSSTSNFLSSPTSTQKIPQQPVNPISSPDEPIPSPLSAFSIDLKNFEETHACDPYSCSGSTNNTHSTTILANFRFPKKRSESFLYRIDENESSRPEDLRYPIPTPTRTSCSTSRRPSLVQPPSHAIATPKPTLFFAIASDDVNEVRQVLESGEAGPNETIGPHSTLEFVLTNDQLVHKAEMIKLLLAYGANPAVLRNQRLSPKSSSRQHGGSRTSLLDNVDPATRYYLRKAEGPETQRSLALMRRSSFQAVTRVRYDIVGQNWPLVQLFKVLSVHTRQLSATPIAVILTGPSGHGKSLLARKFGQLLDVPTHVVNMTTLKSTHDLWQSYSMNPHDETPTKCTLAEFLMNNEGKRCVVVLDEIDKTVDEKVLWSLLMPWEQGRCSIGAHNRHIDVRNVVWFGTSNVGHDLVFEYQNGRAHPQNPISQEEYIELTGILRPKLSDHLGSSVLSRVTAVLPFVPFTPEERKVICYEAMNMLGGDAVRNLSPQVVDKVVKNALADYSPQEGARSLYRVISDQLADNL